MAKACLQNLTIQGYGPHETASASSASDMTHGTIALLNFYTLQ